MLEELEDSLVAITHYD